MFNKNFINGIQIFVAATTVATTIVKLVESYNKLNEEKSANDVCKKIHMEIHKLTSLFIEQDIPNEERCVRLRKTVDTLVNKHCSKLTGRRRLRAVAEITRHVDDYCRLWK
ncbi:hypothetical protein KEN51_CDS0029 [Pseudomonas phage vB_Pae10145-KEN51]|nr:hypothetical protein [Pseudomonas aeruginosa]YP_009617316.1 hypothetical protein FDI90_gp028 [Pseudomonas phage PA7]ANM44767.1 hypothetical protein KTN4_009 [Pseudomonas phage KTN4]QGK90006.1 hypothetical protein [Pseudomonas phage vB_PA32_GUMS]QOV07863.1 hypothetical protein [Pseudomonas phage vB_PaeM_kmuB]QYV98784.1 hypothetical protein [Pseudomonas phage T2P]QYV99174.1 hypothetical protein [Pseudomonas phage U1B]QYV99629.1 hypothetical protein [Pseudomonas phage U5]USL86598.1 hypothet